MRSELFPLQFFSVIFMHNLLIEGPFSVSGYNYPAESYANLSNQLFLTLKSGAEKDKGEESETSVEISTENVMEAFDYDAVTQQKSSIPDFETTMEDKTEFPDCVSTNLTPSTEVQRDKYPYEAPSILESLWGVCGIRSKTKKDVAMKIVSGREAEPHSWPWIAGLYKARLIRVNKTVQIGTQPHPFCGASLISPRHLITATHCMVHINRTNTAYLPKNKWLRTQSYLPYDIVAKLGDHSVLEDNEFMEENLVKELMLYEGFNKFLLHDITILKLAHPVKFKKAIRPVCVPPASYELPGGTKCMAVGWGSTNRAWVTASPVLKEDELTIMPTELCKAYADIISEESHICAGGADRITGKGDSGGGLYCKLSADDERWFIFGVTSLGTRIPGPTVFASVASISSWFYKHVKE